MSIKGRRCRREAHISTARITIEWIALCGPRSRARPWTSVSAAEVTHFPSRYGSCAPCHFVRSPAHAFRQDEDGAIMVIGLFFGMLLVGMLWFLFGLAESVTYRMHCQEAADAIALSSAIVHARGMNFIAACNLMMVGLVAYWRVLSLFDYVLAQSLVRYITHPAHHWSGPPCQFWNNITDSPPVNVDDCAAQ